MKKHLTFLLLLVITAFLITVSAQDQPLPSSKFKLSLNEFTDNHHRIFNNDESNISLEQLISKKAGYQQNLPDLTKGYNPLKNTKNGDGLIYEYDSIYIFKNTGIFLREFATCDPSGKPLTELIQEWLPGSNLWRNSSKNTFSYDASGNQVGILLQTWSDGNNTWIDYVKADYTYDASGNMLSGVYQLWDEGNSKWLYSQKDMMNYDNSGNLLSEISQVWDIINNIWLNSYKSEFTYNAVGNKLSEVNQNWETGTNTWLNTGKTSLTYDASENLLIFVVQYWDLYENIWINNSHGLYTYDASGNMTTFHSLSWDAGNSVWINSWNYIYTYDSSGNILTELGQLWDSGINDWGNYSNFSYTWDDSQNLLSEIGHNWDEGTSAWINDSKCEFHNDYNNEKVLATYYEWNQAWVPADGNININLFENDFYWGYGVQKIEFYYSTYVSGIEDLTGKGNDAFEVYPNPAGNTVNFKFNSTSQVSKTISIYDQFGKVVKEIPTGNLFSGENTLTMDVSSLATGIYLLKFSCGGFYQILKLVISK